MRDPITALIVCLAAFRVIDRVLTHRERRRQAEPRRIVEVRGYDALEVEVALHAAARRAAGPDEGEQLLAAIVDTVLEDLDRGVLTDPRDVEAPPA